MNTTAQKNKIISFSQALYNKHSNQELSLHATGAINPDHKVSIGDAAYQTLVNFNTATIENQRNFLEKDPAVVVKAHVKAIVKLDLHKEPLNYLLPSLDAILFGKKNKKK